MIIPTDQNFRRVETHNETIKQRPGCQVTLALTTLPMCHRCLELGALVAGVVVLEDWCLSDCNVSTPYAAKVYRVAPTNYRSILYVSHSHKGENDGQLVMNYIFNIL